MSRRKWKKIITFLVTVKKKLKELVKKEKKLNPKLYFTNGFWHLNFVVSLLSNVVDNLDAKIYKIKCK